MYGAVVRAPGLTSGLTQLSFNPLVSLLVRNAAKPVRARVLNKYDIEVDPHDYHGRVLMLFGTNDPKVQGVVRALHRPGEVFLDIGANYSSIGFAAAECVGPTGAVHLFEPQPRLCRVVTAALEGSGLQQITLHPIGLFDKDDTLELARPPHHSGMATFEARDGTADWERETLRVRKIDDYLPPLVKDRVFGAKVDVEGVEPKILPWLVAQPNLAFLVFEAAHHHEELWRIVTGAGLQVYGLCRRPLGLRVQRCKEFADLANYHDLLGVRLANPDQAPEHCHPSRLAGLLQRDPT